MVSGNIEYPHVLVELPLRGPKLHVRPQHTLHTALKLVEDLAASGSGLRS